MSTAAVKQVAASRQLTRALFASKSVMESLKSKDFGVLLSYNNTTFDNGEGQITVTSAGSDRILITVKDKTVPAGRQVELNTLRSRFE